MPRAIDEVPEHFERLPLRVTIRLAAWGLAGVLAAGAVGLRLAAEPSWPAAPFVGLLGALAALSVVAAYRLGAYEISVTRSVLSAGFPPFSVAVPRAAVRPIVSGAATSWRRFYADREVTLEIDDPRGTVRRRFPSADAAAFLTTLGTDDRPPPTLSQ